MSTYVIKQNSFRLALLSVLVCCALLLSFCSSFGVTAHAESGPADGKHTAEITLVSKDTNNIRFIYLSGIQLNSDLKGISYDKGTNTLTLQNAELGKDKNHYSLTVTNMGDNFKLNLLGHNSLDFLSLESVGYNTGCTITGYGTLNLGYLDVDTNGSKLNVSITDTVKINLDTAKMGYENLPAIRVTSKEQLHATESILKIFGAADREIVYTETVSAKSHIYESSTSQVTISPKKQVKLGPDKQWRYFVNNRPNTTFNGLAANEFGIWKIKDGHVDFPYVGLCSDANGTYMVNRGKVDLTFNGIVTNDRGKWFVQNGMVPFNYVGPMVLNGHKYMIDKGQVK